MTELYGPGVAFECSAQSGMHINEDHFIAEIIDPDTGEVLPEGAQGELVFTSITKEAFPLLRYRTRDICSLTHEKCACGRTTVRMTKPKGRTDDMLIIRGTNVFPSQVEDILAGIEGVSPHYRIEVDNDNGLDHMVIMVELLPEAFSDSFEEMDRFRKQIQTKLKDTMLVSSDVKLIEPGGIERSFGKTKHVTDRRN